MRFWITFLRMNKHLKLEENQFLLSVEFSQYVLEMDREWRRLECYFQPYPKDLHQYTFLSQIHEDPEQYQQNHFHQLEREFNVGTQEYPSMDYWPTVEKRAKTRVLEPFLKTLALQISEISSVASKTPKAPPLNNQSIDEWDYLGIIYPLAWTTRSGIRSRSNRWVSSM